MIYLRPSKRVERHGNSVVVRVDLNAQEPLVESELYGDEPARVVRVHDVIHTGEVAHLAHEIGIHPSLAWLLPVALGVYGFCAFATGARADVRAALLLMIACQGLAHLLAVGLVPRHWLLVIAVSAVAPIVCWRVHHLGQHAPSGEPEPIADVAAEAGDDSVPLRAIGDAVPVVAEGVGTQAEQVRAAPRTSRSRAEWRTIIEVAQSEHPSLNRKQLAARVGCSDRWLRACLNPA